MHFYLQEDIAKTPAFPELTSTSKSNLIKYLNCYINEKREG